MKYTPYSLVAAVGFALAFTAVANAFDIPISLNTKAVFAEEVIDGITVKTSTITVSEAGPGGQVVYKTQKEAVVPMGDGSSKQIIMQTEMTVTPKAGDPTKFIVDSTTTTVTTPMSSTNVPGTPTTVVNDPPAAETPAAALVIPPVSGVVVDGNVLETVPAVSGQ